VLFCRGLSLALAIFLGLAPLVPPEHAHEQENDGQREVVIHQHAHAHAMGHAPASRDSRRVFDHPDDLLLTLSTIFTAPTPPMPAVPNLAVVAMLDPPRIAVHHDPNEFVELLIHGPPRGPTGLRAPPTFLS
jgi:hypothetical protein